MDLTVRPGGHVLPERVEEDLPRAVETLRKSGLAVPLITTAITDANDPLTRRVLATAKKLGVANYRMGYWTFPANTDPLKALREMKPRAAALAALNREIGIRGGYQNHVGTRSGRLGLGSRRAARGDRARRARRAVRHPPRRSGGRRELAGRAAVDRAAHRHGRR